MAPPGPPRRGRPTDTDRRQFVRVVEREGWDVELVAEGRRVTCTTRDEAMRAALAAEPDWVEIGEVEPETPASPRHHRWRTLRRTPAGVYVESGLSWGGPAGPR